MFSGSSRAISVILFALATFSVGAQVQRENAAAFNLSDDSLYYFFCGLKILGYGDAKAHEKVYNEFVYSHYPEGTVFRKRTQFKSDNASNYLLPDSVRAASGILLSTGEDAPERIATSVFFGQVAWAVLALVIFFALCLALLRPRALCLVSITLFVLVLLNHVGFDRYYDVGFSLNPGRIWHNWREVLKYLVDPHEVMSPFGLASRSQFVLFVLLVFALRWQGDLFQSYVAAAGLLLVHQTQAALLLGTLICLDVVTKPEKLLQLRFIAVFCVLLLIVATNAAWHISAAPALIGFAATVALLVVSYLYRAGFLNRALTLHAHVVSPHVQRWNSVLVDIVLLCLVFGAVAILSRVGGSIAHPFEMATVWSLLQGRWLGIFRVAGVLGIVWLAGDLADKARPELSRAFQALTLVLAVASVVVSIDDMRSASLNVLRDRLSTEATRYEGELKQTRETFVPADEGLFTYALIHDTLFKSATLGALTRSRRKAERSEVP